MTFSSTCCASYVYTSTALATVHSNMMRTYNCQELSKVRSFWRPLSRQSLRSQGNLMVALDCSCIMRTKTLAEAPSEVTCVGLRSATVRAGRVPPAHSTVGRRAHRLVLARTSGTHYAGMNAMVYRCSIQLEIEVCDCPFRTVAMEHWPYPEI